MSIQCENCNATFASKSGLTSHKNRKFPCKKAEPIIATPQVKPTTKAIPKSKINIETPIEQPKVATPTKKSKVTPIVEPEPEIILPHKRSKPTSTPKSKVTPIVEQPKPQKQKPQPKPKATQKAPTKKQQQQNNQTLQNNQLMQGMQGMQNMMPNMQNNQALQQMQQMMPNMPFMDPNSTVTINTIINGKIVHTTTKSSNEIVSANAPDMLNGSLNGMFDQNLINLINNNIYENVNNLGNYLEDSDDDDDDSDDFDKSMFEDGKFDPENMTEEFKELLDKIFPSAYIEILAPIVINVVKRNNKLEVSGLEGCYLTRAIDKNTGNILENYYEVIFNNDAYIEYLMNDDEVINKDFQIKVKNSKDIVMEQFFTYMYIKDIYVDIKVYDDDIHEIEDAAIPTLQLQAYLQTRKYKLDHKGETKMITDEDDILNILNDVIYGYIKSMVIDPYYVGFDDS